MTATIALTGAFEAGAQTSPADGAETRASEQLLHYNHAYAVVDRETADAIENSDYLREFANFEVRTTTGGGLTWTGRYLYGAETYIEFFGEGDLPGADALYGASGLGVSTEHAGDLATVTDRLRDLGIEEPAPYRQTRDFGDGVRVPWFDTIRTTSDLYDAFDAWSMEYLPEYFADPRGNTGPESYPGDVSAARYLSDDYQDHQLRDVTQLHLGVPERDLATTVPLLEAGGYDVETRGNGTVVVNDGTTTIRLDPVPLDEVGLRGLQFSLNDATGTRHVEEIGRSTLTVGPGARAVWTFDAPE
ncbi:hypothetical protein E1283_21405 [Streptomyces hainanensis]|uniref:Uncharacterized protein n=2 Tax=Streptomyces hainanensis TaxID=402648 RepID=A0A4R4T672_9ACTN|nr:hypothetical protein E1283_21405 [Streptomyces hainanensis]